MALPPRKKMVDKEEVVLDANMCLENKCPLLEKKKINGEEFYSCGVDVFQADIPSIILDENGVADKKKEPVLLRIVMAPGNTTRWCGLKTINYKMEEIEINDEDLDEDLFT